MTQQQDWITVGALADGFNLDNYTLPVSNDLNGRTLVLDGPSGESITYRFSQNAVGWSSADHSISHEAASRVTSIREGIYLIDFLQQTDTSTASISLVLDVKQGVFTRVYGQLPTQDDQRSDLFRCALSGQDLTPVSAQFTHGTIQGLYSGTSLSEANHPHQPTHELVGIRNCYAYSPHEVYEHIYLNENLYSWHCLSGVERGLADTDRCHYFKLENELYLFVWREKIIPTLGLVLIDLKQHRSDGKICGHTGDDLGQWSNFPVGSFSRILNTTEYPGHE